MTLNGATSLENGPSTPKELTVEEVQVGGVPAKHAEHWKAPEIVESAFKNTTLTFRNPSNSNKKKKHPAAIERAYPKRETCHRGTSSS